MGGITRVGLTGGYATGKSFVAAELERLGCRVIYADRLGHAVLRRGGVAFTPVVTLFGERILDEQSGEIDRKRLGAIVFQSPRSLEQLNSIVHPAVYRLQDEIESAIRSDEPEALVVVEAAILIETGSYRNYQRLVLTTCDEEEQIRRAMQRDRLTAEQVRMRIREQMSSSEKIKCADYVVDTGGSREETILQTQRIYLELKAA